MLTTRAFWSATAERAARTAAQVLVSTLGLDHLGVTDVGWAQGLALAGSGALLAVLTAVATSESTGGGPGITERLRERG